MEQLSESLAASFQISSDPNSTASPHPRMCEYKIKPSNVPDQQTRRERMLEQQKSRRQDRVNHARRLAEEEEMEFSNSVDTKKTKASTVEKSKNPYKNQLMLSEWLVDLPINFDQEWIMVVSPIGKRCLVIASRSSTSVYSKSGYCVNRFSSLLPGGCKETFRPSEYTILDCIYSEVNRTFYILDVMCWRGHPVYDSETEFRFYWLQTKLEENPEILTTSKNNPYIFVAAERTSCDQQSVYDILKKDKSYKIDGVLFYHKQAHYHPGNTPLVGWLKVYMIPELTGLSVPEEFLFNVPKVHKLTLEKENETFRGREMKLMGEGDGMEIEQKKRKQEKKKNKEMVVDEGNEQEPNGEMKQ